MIAAGFALSQPAIPVAAASEVRRHAVMQARTIAQMAPDAKVAELPAMLDAMATWLNHVGIDAATKTSF